MIMSLPAFFWRYARHYVAWGLLAGAGIVLFAAATAATASLIKPIFAEVLLAGDRAPDPLGGGMAGFGASEAHAPAGSAAPAPAGPAAPAAAVAGAAAGGTPAPAGRSPAGGTGRSTGLTTRRRWPRPRRSCRT